MVVATDIIIVKMNLLRFFSHLCSITRGAMAMVSNMIAKGITIHSSTCCITFYKV